MRRTDKEILNRDQINAIIRGSTVCHLALAHNNVPYLVPVSFGYDGDALYLHTARSGRKIEFFERNPQICFEFERNVELRKHDQLACKWSLNYESVIGYGTIAEVQDPTEKQTALNHIMRQYSGKDWTFEPSAVSDTRTWKITFTDLTGKQSKPKAG
jgi:nitroimidazol reductase NimA-like FMN-containing flavoprotein (pyridoxamine 5'-phosphate oxidase superfamily)